MVSLSLTLQFVLRRHIRALAEFQDNGDGVGITGHVDEILKLVDIHFYILLALKVVV
jgi:hypothetical protein